MLAAPIARIFPDLTDRQTARESIKSAQPARPIRTDSGKTIPGRLALRVDNERRFGRPRRLAYPRMARTQS